MSLIRFKNANILTFEGDDSAFFRQGNLVVKGRDIAFIGNDEELGSAFSDDTSYDRIIDCNGDILMPALVNSHAHSAMTLFRGLGENRALQDWLCNVIFPLEALLDEEAVYAGTMMAVLEYLRNGITSVCDMYFFPDTLFEAYDKSFMRAKFTSAFMDFDGNYNGELKRLDNFYSKYNNKTELFGFIVGTHAEYTNSHKLLCGVSEFARAHKAPTYIHISETRREVEECKARHDGLTPPQYLERIGFFDYGGTVAHGTYLNESDVKIFARKNVCVVNNPSSNLKLGSGFAPISLLLGNKIRLSLGTDGAASNNKLSLFSEMRLLSLLEKGVKNDPTVVSLNDVLRAATINGAKSLYLDNVGQLKVGAKADIVRINTRIPSMQPRRNMLSHLVYSSSSGNVLMTMCNGRILYEDGQYFIGEDVDRIYSLFEKSVKRIYEKGGVKA